VANIRSFLPGLRHVPEFITEADCAEGFCEAAEVILKRRDAATDRGR
jgi:hypothetical protein